MVAHTVSGVLPSGRALRVRFYAAFVSGFCTAEIILHVVRLQEFLFAKQNINSCHFSKRNMLEDDTVGLRCLCHRDIGGI